MNGHEFLYYWLIFTLLVLVFCGVVVFLAYRAGYFRDQERARYLALWAEVPPNERADAGSSPDHLVEGAGERNLSSLEGKE